LTQEVYSALYYCSHRREQECGLENLDLVDEDWTIELAVEYPGQVRTPRNVLKWFIARQILPVWYFELEELFGRLIGLIEAELQV
jgi:hypothetical protein